MNNLGTRRNPLTHESQGDGCYKYCRCAECGIVAKATPHFDFYESAFRHDDALVCEPCFMAKALCRTSKPVRDLASDEERAQ